MYNDYAELYIQMVEVNCALFWSETGFGQGWATGPYNDLSEKEIVG